MAELAEVDLENWTPLFDPDKFNEMQGPLLLNNYKLSHAELQSWAERISTLRKRIVEKAKQFIPNEPDVQVDLPMARGR